MQDPYKGHTFQDAIARRAGSKATRCRGVTVVELVVAVSLMLVIIGLVAPVLHAVQNSWARREADGENLANARAFAHHFRRHLSPALRITAVSDGETPEGHIQFVAADGVEVRYEAAAGGNIRFGPVGETADLVGPVRTLRFTCYDASDFTRPVVDAGSIRLVVVEARFAGARSAQRDHRLCTCVYVRTDGASAHNDVAGSHPTH